MDECNLLHKLQKLYDDSDQNSKKTLSSIVDDITEVLEYKNEEISELKILVKSKDDEIEDLQDTIANLKTKLKSSETDFRYTTDNLKSRISNLESELFRNS